MYVMIKINKGAKVYVMCPAAYATGGPELLHQFAYCLRNNGIDAYMYYIPTDVEKPVHDAFSQYHVPYVREIEDNEVNVLVTSEGYSHIKLAYRYKKIRKYLWWLSVDNFFITRDLDNPFTRFIINACRVVDILCAKLFNRHVYDMPKHVMSKYSTFSSLDDKYLGMYHGHFYQSEYAKDTLLRIGISDDKIYALSDYLNDDFLSSSIDFKGEKEDIVLYYPRKGIVFTSKIVRKSSDDIRYIPIQGYTRNQMVDLLRRAKVYIDFGNHQGKDRIPREAAISKCCIITGKRGSANNTVDIAIPNEYKFNETQMNEIIAKIKECLYEYDKKINDFHFYCESIANEKKVFHEQVKGLFQINE